MDEIIKFKPIKEVYNTIYDIHTPQENTIIKSKEILSLEKEII